LELREGHCIQYILWQDQNAPDTRNLSTSRHVCCRISRQRAGGAAHGDVS
jgi:hypothetical protein